MEIENARKADKSILFQNVLGFDISEREGITCTLNLITCPTKINEL
jgi:hypothetical protein